jgi:hypothetical protein
VNGRREQQQAGEEQDQCLRQTRLADRNDADPGSEEKHRDHGAVAGPDQVEQPEE